MNSSTSHRGGAWPRIRDFWRAAVIGGVIGACVSVPALALGDTVEYYCLSCRIPQNAIIYNPTYHGGSNGTYIRQTYVHYLGTGTRYLGTGIKDEGGWSWGTNEVVWYSSVGHSGRAAAGQDPNHTQHTYVTVNANDSYITY